MKSNNTTVELQTDFRRGVPIIQLHLLNSLSSAVKYHILSNREWEQNRLNALDGLQQQYLVSVIFASTSHEDMKGSTGMDSSVVEFRVRVPAGTAGEFSSPESAFGRADSCFGIRSTPYYRSSTQRKISRSFCQKCKRKVTPKHARTLRMRRRIK